MVMLGVGPGISFVPITIAGTSGVAREDSGLASGLLNTTQQVGGALGLAILSTVATHRTTSALHAGLALPAALTHGFKGVFVVSGGPDRCGRQSSRSRCCRAADTNVRRRARRSRRALVRARPRSATLGAPRAAGGLRPPPPRQPCALLASTRKRAGSRQVPSDEDIVADSVNGPPTQPQPSATDAVSRSPTASVPAPRIVGAIPTIRRLTSRPPQERGDDGATALYEQRDARHARAAAEVSPRGRLPRVGGRRLHVPRRHGPEVPFSARGQIARW